MRALLPLRRFPAACTIVSRNNLSFARVLASSCLQHQAGARFYMLVVDKLPGGAVAGPGIQLIDPGELYLPYLTELCFLGLMAVISLSRTRPNRPVVSNN